MCENIRFASHKDSAVAKAERKREGTQERPI